VQPERTDKESFNMTRPMDNLDLKTIHKRGSAWDEWEKGEHEEALRMNYDDVILTRSDLEFLRGIERKVNILAICEPWCGDVHRQLPILVRMCEANPLLDLRIINRDEHLGVMERYLTNGARSIPVFVVFNDDYVEVGCWKARPQVCRQVLERAKAAGELDEGKRAIQEIMDLTNNRLTIEEIKILMDRALAESGRWQLFCEDAMDRLTPMSSEEAINRKDLERVLDVYHCQDQVEVLLVQDALKRAGVHFFMQFFQDRVWDGLLEQDKGVAVVQVLEEDVEQALEIIEEVLFPDEEEEEEV
jgi:hypothetical protein